MAAFRIVWILVEFIMFHSHCTYCTSNFNENKDDVIRILLQEVQNLKANQVQMNDAIDTLKVTVAKHEVELLEERNKFQELKTQYEVLKKEQQSMRKSILQLQENCMKRTDHIVNEVEIGSQLQNTSSKIVQGFTKGRLARDKDNRNKRLNPQPKAMLTNQVAFYADLSNDLSTLGRLHTIVYDNVKTNIGNGYNRNDGIFTAPVSGVYVFSWYGMAQGSYSEELDIVVDGQYFTRSYTTNLNLESASKTVAIDLNQGNEVWIRTSGDNGQGKLSGSHYNSFTGWLLYPRE